MTDFVCMTNLVLHGHGHHIPMLAGVARGIPQVLEGAAKEHGCVPTDVFNKIVAEVPSAKEKREEAEAERVARTEAIRAAINDVIGSNDPTLITPSGEPRVSAVKARLSFSPTAAEVRKVFHDVVEAI